MLNYNFAVYLDLKRKRDKIAAKNSSSYKEEEYILNDMDSVYRKFTQNEKKELNVLIDKMHDNVDESLNQRNHLKLKTIYEKIEVQESMSDLEQMCIKYSNALQAQNSTAANKFRGLITARLVNMNWNWNYVKYFVNDLLNIHSEKDLYQLFAQYHLLDEE